MGNNPNALAIKSNGSGSNLPALITEDDRRVAQFLKQTLPYGKDLTDDNAIALSAYCRAFVLSPQNQEAYYLVRVDKQSGKRTELGVYAGIKAWRKKAKEQLHAVDPMATYKIDFEQIDPKELGLDPRNVAICIKATLRDEISRGRYLAEYVKLLTAGLKAQDIKELIGEPPSWIGYGTVKNVELPYLKMEPRRVAEKRAEKDATSRRFDLPFAGETFDEDIETTGADFDGEYSEAPQEKKPRRSEKQIMSDLGFSPAATIAEPEEIIEIDESEMTPVLPEEDQPGEAEPATTQPAVPPLRCTPDVLKRRLAETAKANKEPLTNGKKGLVAQVLEAILSGTTDPKASRKQLLVYLIGKDSLSEATDNETMALYRWLSPVKNEMSGEWLADPMAAREALAAFNECQPKQDGLF